MTSPPLPPDALAALRDAVGAAHVRTGDQVAAMDPGWEPDNLAAGVVVAPGSTAEVAAVVAACARHGVAIVPHGGRTGLVGGGLSVPGQIVLSTARLDRIVDLDPVSRVAVVESGVTLQTLQAAALPFGLDCGIDLPSRGSASIGGMVSTNAGGLMAFRNGVMRHRVFGLEAVLADGSVYADLTRVVKNAAGYDLKHLFIGGEGTLGLVTRVAIKLDPIPGASATALFGLPSVEAVLKTIRRALDGEGHRLRAAEALWQRFFALNANAQGFTDASLDRDRPIYLLLGFGGGADAVLQQAFEQLFEATLDAYPDATGIIATSQRQEHALWQLRENTHEMYRVYPAAPSYDVSLPLAAIETYVPRMQAALRNVDPDLDPFVFGHLADGNLHITLNRQGPLPPTMREPVEAAIYGGITALGGSFSAEHGVGSKRRHALQATASPVKLATMAAIKRLLDPQNLFNPGKVLM
jgi:FAD/FMN-containing dehydrogenase